VFLKRPTFHDHGIKYYKLLKRLLQIRYSVILARFLVLALTLCSYGATRAQIYLRKRVAVLPFIYLRFILTTVSVPQPTQCQTLRRSVNN
jgi:hypothetical protein